MVISIQFDDPPAKKARIDFTSAGKDPLTVQRTSGVARENPVNISADYTGDQTPTAITYTQDGQRALVNSNITAQMLTMKKKGCDEPCYPTFGDMGTKLSSDGYPAHYPESFTMSKKGKVTAYTFSDTPRTFKADFTDEGVSSELLKYTGNTDTNDHLDDPNTLIIHIGKKGGGDEGILFPAFDERNVQKKNMLTFTPKEMADGTAKAAIEKWRASAPDPSKAKAVLALTATAQVDDIRDGKATPLDNNVRLSNYSGGAATDIAYEADYRSFKGYLNSVFSDVGELGLTCNMENLNSTTK